MKNFWVQFAISEALSVVQAFVASNAGMNPALKTALENFITSGQAVVSAFNG